MAMGKIVDLDANELCCAIDALEEQQAELKRLGAECASCAMALRKLREALDRHRKQVLSLL